MQEIKNFMADQKMKKLKEQTKILMDFRTRKELSPGILLKYKPEHWPSIIQGNDPTLQNKNFETTILNWVITQDPPVSVIIKILENFNNDFPLDAESKTRN